MQQAAKAQEGARAPLLLDWDRLWRLWDAATLEMIPADSITAKPLQLRHPFIFYVGHLPAFTDARLAQVLQQQLSEPADFADMFARGIDPDLEDPTKCHDHSPVPDVWPQLSVILQYRDRVRTRVKGLYQTYSSKDPKLQQAAKEPQTDAASLQAAVADTHCRLQWLAVAHMPFEVQHVLWMCYEHEAMHLETLLYMLVQYERVRPPPQSVLQHSTLADVAAMSGTPAPRQDTQPVETTNMSVNISQDLSCSKTPISELVQLPPPATWVYLPGQHVVKGFDSACQIDTELKTPDSMIQQQQHQDDTAPAAPGCCLHRFGWDNESPARTEEVGSCFVQHRPVSMMEYLWFMAHQIREYLHNQQQLKPADPATAPNFCTRGFHSHGCSACCCRDDGEVCRCSRGGQQGCNSNSSATLPLSAAIHKLLGSEGALHHLMPLSLFVLPPSASLASVTEAAAIGVHAGDGQASSDHILLDILQQMVTVKTVFGKVPITTAAYWPVYCSAQQAELYAEWWDTLDRTPNSSSSSISKVAGSSRLPSEGELLLARDYNAAVMSASSAGAADGTGAAASTHVAGKGGPAATTRVSRDTAAAVDFNSWHPVDVQLQPSYIRCTASVALQTGLDLTSITCSSKSRQPPALPPSPQQQHSASCTVPLLSQLQDNGWEWSSSMLDRHHRFEPHHLYPEYSVDFFDGKHRVLLGGSWATISSIADRATFRNFYQAGQQHVFAKFRLCKTGQFA